MCWAGTLWELDSVCSLPVQGAMDTSPGAAVQVLAALQGFPRPGQAGLTRTWHRGVVALSQSQLQPYPQPFLNPPQMHSPASSTP